MPFGLLKSRIRIAILAVLIVLLSIVIVFNTNIRNVNGRNSTYCYKSTYVNVKGVGLVEGKGLAIVAGNGTIYSACGMLKVASLGGVYEKYANCFRRFYVNSNGVIYGFCANRTSVIVIHNGSVIRANMSDIVGNGVLIQLAPCVKDSCFAVLFANDTGVYIAVYRSRDGGLDVDVYRSNSLVLTYINGSITGSLYDVRYNESAFVDVVSGRVLFYVPAVKALSSIGRVFVEPILINRTIEVVLIVSNNLGVQYFISKPNSLRFNVLDRPVATSPSMNYFVIRNDSMGRIVVLDDGTTFYVRYPVSVLDMRSLMFAEPKEAVVYADSSAHVILIRVFEGGKAGVVFMKKGVNEYDEYLVWRGEAKSISQVFAWYCMSTNTIAVVDLSAGSLYHISLGSCK